MLDVHKGTYYALTGNAPQAWSALRAGQTVSDTAAQIAAQTGADQDTVAGDLADFLSILVDDGVLLPLEGDATLSEPSATPAKVLTDYLGFVCDKHSDLDELLVLDPIHDVNPHMGWPHER